MSDEQDLAELAAAPVTYETPVDHYREMARRFAESRDELKHRCRELESRPVVPVAALRALLDQWRVPKILTAGDAIRYLCADQLAALCDAAEKPPVVNS